MLIDLFRNNEIDKKSNRTGNQIESRKFQLERSLAPLDEIESDLPEFKKYKEACYGWQGGKREYGDIIGNFYDPWYDLELLGVARYAKSYTVVVDFSECLDIILSVISGCDPQSIRKLKNYSQISKELLNFELTDSTQIPITDLIDLDKELTRWFNELIYAKRSYLCSADLQDAAYSVLFSFYSEILGTLEHMKDYVGTYLGDLGLPNTVYRSKSKSSILVSTDTRLEQESEIVLRYGEYTSTAKCYCFKPFEYAQLLGGGLIEHFR